MRRLLGDKEHLIRMAGLFAVGVTVFLVMQRALVPPGFGVYGHYRAGALDDNRDAAAHPLRFAGHAACEACHADVVEARKGGKHEPVACEACHWAQAAHATAADPSAAKPQRPDGRTTCLKCHAANVARPVAFPQIVVAEHGESRPCIECHRPHSPVVK